VSLVLTIVVVWIAASILVAAGWMLLAVYLRRERRAEEQTVREWLRRMRPRLPRQRSGGDGEEPRDDHGDPAA
jgi:hypothetical protein